MSLARHNRQRTICPIIVVVGVLLSTSVDQSAYAIEDSHSSATKSEEPDYKKYLKEATSPSPSYSKRKLALKKAFKATKESSQERLSVIYAILTLRSAVNFQDPDFPDQISLCKQALELAEQVTPQDLPECWLRLAAYQAQAQDVDAALKSAREGIKKLDRNSNLNPYGLLPPFGLTYLLYKTGAKVQAKELMDEAISRTAEVFGRSSREANLQRVNKFELLVRHKEYEEAHQTLTEALENISYTLPDARYFLKEAPLPDLQRIYHCAIESVQEFDCQFAEYVINSVLAKEKAKLPTSDKANYVRNGLCALAHCYYRAGLYPKSFQTYSAVLKLEKENHLSELSHSIKQELQEVYKKQGKQLEGRYAEEKTVSVD